MVTGEFPPLQGGVGDYSARLAQFLGKVDVEVEIATGPLPGDRRHLDQAREWAFPVHRTVHTWGWGCWSIVARLAQERSADVLHIQYQAAAYAMHPAINLLPWWLRLTGSNLPSVVTFHDLRVPYLFPKAGPVRWWSITALATGSRAAILTNVEDFDRLAPYAQRVRRYQIPLAPNFKPDHQYPAQRANAKPHREELVISHFGFLNESKGCQDLVEALAQIRDADSKPAFSLHIVGGTAGDSDPANLAFRERLQAQIARHRLDRRVTWTGFLPQEKASATLLDSDLCVLPYRDGASFRRGTLLIALVHGLPIITTEPVVPIPEFHHGENVWLVPRQNPEALAGAILHLADRPDLRQHLRQGAQELGRAFRWDRIAQATRKVYHDVLGA